MFVYMHSLQPCHDQLGNDSLLNMVLYLLWTCVGGLSLYTSRNYRRIWVVLVAGISGVATIGRITAFCFPPTQYAIGASANFSNTHAHTGDFPINPAHTPR